MDNPRILILSPHSDEISRLQKALSEAGFLRPAEEVRTDLPRADLAELSSPDNPVRAVLVDLSRGPAAYSVLRTARRALPTAVAVAASGPRRLSAVVQARQSGAWGYVTAPYDLRPLAERLGVSAPVAPEPRGGSIISFLPSQGGSGASTVGLHVANAIAERLGGDTLLIDYDFHTGTVGFQLGLEATDGLAAVLECENIDRGFVERAAKRWNQLDVLTSPADPSAIHQNARLQSQEVFKRLKKLYKAVIVDLPSPLLTSALDTLAVSDLCFLVCTPEITSLHLAKRKVDQLKNREMAGGPVRLLVNRAGSLGGLENRHIERIVGAKVEWAIDNDYAAVRKAAWEGGLVEPDTPLSDQTRQLADELLQDLQLEPKQAPEPLAAFATEVGS